MRVYCLLFSALYTWGSAAWADVYPQRILVSGAVVCSKAGDWSDMVEASIDEDEVAAGQLLQSGKCRIVSSAMRVNLIEPEKRGIGALIELPSGKTAITSERFLR
ncbi:hypothetical protein [Pseudomonas citronellolis]|uniref:hypothetical protein n=1 Tax=Pseudomonas citronellolis TaxID=53408 RepID=UPI00248D755E|nr:hypothetical protein [Pseudomonas citronellolis]